ncbi:MAG: hypothetical protein EZS28_009605 [Streblomastix strix]|uniref:Uncharacterized protein n=1 Tax=Streblomastix strix TaxID=222440 RepID=A0A5J4WKP4_9EUKA|nr:MAG: hypothetical protein EZS28_009605 [Streblomastix strix]
MKKRRHELISLCEELTKRVVMEGDFEAHWATIVHFWISLQEEERMSHIVAQYAEVREKELERETKNPKEKEKERIRQWKEMEKK